jgi:hypothetical protein
MKIFYTLSIFLIVSLQVSGQERQRRIPQKEESARIVKFYPNPAVSVINFDFPRATDKTYSFQIFSLTGKKMHEITKVDQKTTVNLSDFYRGIYIFQLKDQFGKLVDSGKFQVSK